LGSATTTDGFAQTLAVNAGTYAITTAAARFLFDTDVGSHNCAVLMDANHFINFWSGASADGFVQTMVVNTTTWAVTTAAAQLEFDTQNCTYTTAQKIDDTHAIAWWLGGAATTDGLVQTFAINTTTWAVTTAAARLQFDTDVGSWNASYPIDENHFINFWTGASGDGFAQVFTVNTSTWAVTTAAAQLEFDTQDHVTNSKTSVAKIDTNHFIHVWAGPDTAAGTAYDGFAQIFEVNTTTWAVTTASAPFEFDTTQGEYNSISEKIAGTTDKYLNIWSGSGDDGFAQVFKVQSPPYQVVLNSPADAGSTTDTTPTLDFTGTDPESDDVRYLTQISTTSVPIPVPSGCVFYSEFVENTGSDVADISGNGNDGTWQGTLGSQWTTGILDSAGNFNGTDNFVDYGSPSNLGLTGDCSFTISAWVYMTSLNLDGAILSLGAGGSTGRVIAMAQYSDYSIRSIHWGSDHVFTAVYTQNGWTHVVITYDSSTSTEKLYRNGTDTSESWTPSNLDMQSGSALYVGKCTWQNVFLGQCRVERVGIWDRALTSAEVAREYQAGFLSGTDAGFANPDNGGDTDPFNSGENIQYTVQSALDDVTTYYWRVRAIDPTGSNTYGAWSSTRSFTVNTGGASTSIKDIIGGGFVMFPR
jgi:hypothetical protein